MNYPRCIDYFKQSLHHDKETKKPNQFHSSLRQIKKKYINLQLVNQEQMNKKQGLSEKQVKNLVQNCNNELSKVTNAHDTAKDKFNQLEKEIAATQLEIQRINIDYENIRVDSIHSEKLCNLLKKYDAEMQAIKNAYFFEGSPSQAVSCPKLESIDFLIQDIEKNSSMEGTKKEQTITFLQQLRFKLLGNLMQVQRKTEIDKISSSYALEFESIRKALSTTTFCSNCKDMYLPEQNHETACFFHPGKLKYFSCRGCGADDYYTCCLKCSRCQGGCANSAHVP